MQYLSSFLLFFTLVGFGGVAVAQSDDAGSANEYDSELVANYNQECLQTSMAEGLDQVAAQKLCDCTITKFQQQYSQEEFIQLTAASASDPTAEAKLVEVGQVCLEQGLYE